MSPFTIRYAALPAGQCLAERDHLLAVVGCAGEGVADSSDPRLIPLPLTPIDPSPLTEIWHSPEPVRAGHREGVAFCCNSQVLVGQLVLDEADYRNLAEASADAYHRILAFLQAQGYEHLLRMWNYFPAINQGEGDAERYRQFVLGRSECLEAHGLLEQALPAATVIGSDQPGFAVYFLAGREAGLQIENPRQTSAFHYPRQYGPKSPLFSRAQLKDWPETSQLFISGTASVVGHESVHRNDVCAQAGEIGRNFQALLDAAADKQPRFAHARLESLTLLRVYLRAPVTDLDAIREAIQQWSGPDVPTQYLYGDICREDLLIEIEGYCEQAAR